MKYLVSILVAGCGASATQPAAPIPPVPTSAPPDDVVMLASAPADALVLEVRAIHWACDVTHPRGAVTPDLRVPAGRAIRLVVATPESPPRAKGLEVTLGGVTRPVVKDHPVELAFRIDKPGTYHWKCPTIPPPRSPLAPGTEASPEWTAQYDPIKPLIAMPPADYEAMIAADTADDPADRVARGAKLYLKKGCVSCHTVDGTPRVGPSWKGIWGTDAKLSDGTTRAVDKAYVTESILHPQAFARPGYPPAMPSFEGQLRDRELSALIAYIESLK